MASGPAWQRDQLDRLRAQLTGTIGSLSPLWRERLRGLGRTAASINTLDDLAMIPAVGERDVSPTGDPAGMAALVVQGGEAGFALHAPTAKVRRALLTRPSDSAAYRQIVDAEMRATTFAWTGLGFRWPVAYTRGDLDVVTRAGARSFGLLGLTAADAVLTVAPAAPDPLSVSLQLAALGTGTPLIVSEPTAEAVDAAARLTPPTVLAVAHDRAELVAAAARALADAGAALRTVLLLGMPADAERAAVQEAAGAGATVLAWHVPAGGRLPWVECRGGGAAAGLHTQPDLDLVQLVDAETGEPAAHDVGGEVVLTQLALRGSAMLRWRTGDLAARLTTEVCAGCGSDIPRLVGVQSGRLVVAPPRASLPIDLRAVAGALSGRADLADWRIIIGPRPRDGELQVLVDVVPADGDAAALVGAATDIRAAAGVLPTQLVATSAAELAERDAVRAEITARIRRRSPRAEPAATGN